MDITIANESGIARKDDCTSPFVSFFNIFLDHLSALDKLGHTLKSYDSSFTWNPNFLLDFNCLGTYGLSSALAAAIPTLPNGGAGLVKMDAGVTSIREYPGGRMAEPERCSEAAANSNAERPERAVTLQDIASTQPPNNPFDILYSNVVHFAYALNEHMLVAIADLNGITTYVNEKFCTVFKYTSREIIGQHYRVINSGCHPDEYLNELWSTVKGGNIWKGDIRNRAKDGVIHWLDATVIPCFDHTGKIYQYIAICNDITTRKRNEEALYASRNELRALANHLEKAQEFERKRIAREIHDELGQHLLALKMDVSSLDTSTLGTHPKLNAKIQFVLQGIDDTMHHVKSIINDLRPVVLELGLVDAVQSHVRAFERRSGIPCEVNISGDNIELDNERTTVLFRVLQESLVNVSRHAQASRASVALYCDADRVSIVISDNGKGIGANGQNKRNSFGLLGMRERIEALDGMFLIQPAAGGGTKITASIPL
jgi:PAS domain S-box-containing protein